MDLDERVLGGRGGERFEPFTLRGGEPARDDFFDGIDTAWGRVAGGAQIDTGLVFFRELPAGVPGAYRLFENLVSLRKE